MHQGQPSQQAAFVTDTLGTIVGWNDACERLLGYPAAAVLGRTSVELVGAARQAQFQRRLAGVVRQTEDMTVELMRANGSAVALLARFLPSWA